MKSTRTWSLVLLASLCAIPACGHVSTVSVATPGPAERADEWSAALGEPTSPPPIEARDAEVSEAELAPIRASLAEAPGQPTLRSARRLLRGRSHDGISRDRIHIVAVGGVTLEAWVAPRAPFDAALYFRVAEIVEATRRAHVDTVVHADGGVSLWTIAEETYICRGGPTPLCFAWPTPKRVQHLSCWASDGSCEIGVVGGDRIEWWQIEMRRERARRRLVSTQPATEPPLDGSMWPVARRERGAWETLPRATRPAAFDEVALSAPTAAHLATAVNDLAPSEEERATCVPRVRSFRDGATVVRAVGCELDPVQEWPSSFIITREDSEWVTPVAADDIGSAEPLRIESIPSLAEGALAFVARHDDGGSPSGAMAHTMWVLVPPTAGRSIELHPLLVRHDDTEGLGMQDEREGYVVGVQRMSLRFDLVGPGRIHLVECVRWSGEHARVSDRWTGTRDIVPLDLSLSFDVDRGFDFTETDSATFMARCLDF